MLKIFDTFITICAFKHSKKKRVFYVFVLLLFVFIIFDINFYIIILQLAIYELS